MTLLENTSDLIVSLHQLTNHVEQQAQKDDSSRFVLSEMKKLYETNGDIKRTD